MKALGGMLVLVACWAAAFIAAGLIAKVAYVAVSFGWRLI